ncbi:MAG: hypothetical protein ABID09_05885 [Candidatus Omnitrophota bacterium]
MSKPRVKLCAEQIPLPGWIKEVVIDSPAVGLSTHSKITRLYEAC